MAKKNEHFKISKIIYFDEDTATDYVQVMNNGSLERTTELFTAINAEAEAGVKVEGSFGLGKLFKALLGTGIDAHFNASASGSVQKDKLVRNILNNTLLTDFLHTFNNNDASCTIEVLDGYKVEIIPKSLSQIITVSPITKMIEGNIAVDQEGSVMNIEKMDTALKLLKGYYEFRGKGSYETKILRFNIESFRNNYKIPDLMLMDLSMLAIKVGSTDSENNFSVDVLVNDATAVKNDKAYFSNPTLTSPTTSATSEAEVGIIPIYDVILAGVR